MGIYVNPTNGQTKSDYLVERGLEVNRENITTFEYEGSDFPVILVDNGIFDAAGVCVDERELEYFLADTSGRPMRFFILDRNDLGQEAGLGNTMDDY